MFANNLKDHLVIHFLISLRKVLLRSNLRGRYFEISSYSCFVAVIAYYILVCHRHTFLIYKKKQFAICKQLN